MFEVKYEYVGQKRAAPMEDDALRKFYASLRAQNPSSVMAETWLMEHGLLESAEEQKLAYARYLKAKKRGSSTKATTKKVPKPKAKTDGKIEAKDAKAKEDANVAKAKAAAAKTTTADDDDDDDTDDDVPLAKRM